MPQYTLNTFLRQTPNGLLQTYFQRSNILSDVPVSKLTPHQIKPIFSAIEKLPEAQQDHLHQEFREIFTLANPSGSQIMADLADFHDLDLADQLRDMSNHYHRAMWLFLNREHHGIDLYEQCLTFSRMEEMSFTRAKRRNGLPCSKMPAHDDATLELMARKIQAVFKPQGRGKRCRVEYAFRPNPDRHCFFAYPEDYSTSDLQYEGNELRPYSRRPVFDIAFVYIPDDGVLEISAPGKQKDIEAFQLAFCQSCLGEVILPANHRPSWNLDHLKRANVQFPTDPEDRIASVAIVALRLSRKDSPRHRLTVEHDPEGPETFHDWMGQALDLQAVPLQTLYVNQARLRVVWHPEGNRPPRKLTFTLGWPDSSTLKDEPSHLLIKKYLRQWGIAS